MPEVLAVSDYAFVYNNSFINPVLIVEKQNGAYILYPQQAPSEWTAEKLISLVGLDKNDVILAYDEGQDSENPSSPNQNKYGFDKSRGTKLKLFD